MNVGTPSVPLAGWSATACCHSTSCFGSAAAIDVAKAAWYDQRSKDRELSLHGTVFVLTCMPTIHKFTAPADPLQFTISSSTCQPVSMMLLHG